MTRLKKHIGITLTIILIGFLAWFYFLLEDFFYSDAGCGCSSACTGFYPTMTSRIIGYILLTTSSLLFVASIWRYKGLSRWWTIIALTVFGLAFYGNGYMLFNKGACGNSINKRTFFINETKIGDYAKVDAETIYLSGLLTGKYKGKLLGYSLRGNELTLYRIAENPIKVKTSFLFWKVRNNMILNHISYGLNTFRNFNVETNFGNYEFIGGQGMTEENFFSEFVISNKELIGKKIKNKRIINERDGTTRFQFETE